MRATVITDASFCSKTRAGGWACWITPDQGERIKHSAQFKTKPENSNEAEILAAINGCVIAYKSGARKILLQSDCLGVESAMKQRPMWVKNKKLYFPDAWVDFRHVKGHTTNPASRSYVNRWCDIMAKVHMRAMRKGQPTSPFAYQQALKEAIQNG